MIGARPSLALGLALVCAAPVLAEAQPPGKVARIGILTPGPLATRVEAWKVFREGMRELGYLEGRSVAFEFRSQERESARLDDLAEDLVRLKVDVIVALGTPTIQAAKRATGTIPIVMAVSADPVQTGLVASLARPGGNVTGLSLLSSELSAKRLELLREIVPRASRVAVLSNPTNASNILQLQGTERAARALGVQLMTLEVTKARDLDRALDAVAKSRVDALLALDDPENVSHAARIVEFAAKHRLPAIYGLPRFVEAGGLVAYGANTRDMVRRAAAFVDRILKGARPADLPVEQPTKFDLVINAGTAKALGLAIPQSLLLRADRVIQ